MKQSVFIFNKNILLFVFQSKNISTLNWATWLTSIILVTWEAEIGRISIQAQTLFKKFLSIQCHGSGDRVPV
jgi:hypothetical protein